MHRKFGNHWVECKDPIDLWTVHQPWILVHVGIKKEQKKGTYDLTDHLMVDLETIIALACMTYIVHLTSYIQEMKSLH